MSHIFLSHTRENWSTAKDLAEALKRSGYSVWWDRNLAAGQKFTREIRDQLAAAWCVVVLWLRHSIESDWVVDEASEGKARLIPMLIEYVTPPNAEQFDAWIDPASMTVPHS